MTNGAIYYAKRDATYVLKFVGEIRCTMGCALDEFLNRLFTRKDFDGIAIDLSDTVTIDSTNLGLLAKIANFMHSRFHRKPLLISTNADVNAVLDSMGFDDVFEICRCDGSCRLNDAELLQIDEPSRGAMARTMLDAHHTLSNLNEYNRREFKSVIGALRKRAAGA